MDKLVFNKTGSLFMVNEMNDDEFIMINIQIIKQIEGEVPFDIYIKRAEGKYSKIIQKGRTVDARRLSVYQKEKGVKKLYIHNEEKKSYNECVESILDAALSEQKNNAVQRIIDNVSEMSRICLDEIYQNSKLEKESVEFAQKCMQGMTKVLSKDPKNFIRLIASLKGHPLQLKHAIMTSLFAVILAQKSGMSSTKSLQTVGMGGMLANVGWSMLDATLMFKKDLTVEELKEVKQHPSLGLQLLASINSISSEVRQIAIQHEEYCNGTGYPNGLFSSEIYQPAKIVTIADHFAEYLLAHEFSEQSYTPQEAIQAMSDDLGHYDKNLLEHFAKIMGVKIKKFGIN